VLLGGTVTRAPLGYKNVHVTDELGRVNRTVEIDPARAHQVTWAFYRYAEGDPTLRTLLDELTDRGLTTTATPKWPSKPLNVTTLHKLLRNPYYKGEVHYRGAAYPGLHEPLVDPHTWQRVQDILTAHHTAGTHQRTNQHYLRGSVYCGSCGSRLMVTTARNKWGTEYPYLVCSGRTRRVTDCQRQAMPIQLIEELIEDEYRTIALSPQLRDDIEQLVLEDFDNLQAAATGERQQMERQRIELTAQRQKLLEAHYAGAIPLDLPKTEQDRIAGQLMRIQEGLSEAEANYEQARATLADTLDLTPDCHAAYLAASDDTRRLFNQAFFAKIYIDEDDETRERAVRVDYNEPFDNLLSRLVPARVHHELAQEETAHEVHSVGGSGGCTPRIAEGQSSHTSTLVEVSGLEPPTSTLRT
jgi:site-specific DNA recombinase